MSQEMRDLIDAEQLLVSKRREVFGDCDLAWEILQNAAAYVKKQQAALLRRAA